MDSSKELLPVGRLIGGSWKRYVSRFNDLVWIPIIPSLVLAIGDYLNIFNNVFLKGIGDFMTFDGVLLSLLSTLALIYAVHNSKQFNESYRYAESIFFRYLWVVILGMVIMIGGLFLLVVPALIFTVWFTLAAYVFVVEGDRGLGAMLKSKEYIRGYFWQLAWRFVVLILVGLIVSIVAGVLGSAGGQSGAIASSFIFEILLAPYLVIYELGIYDNLRQLRPEIVGTRILNGRIGFTFIAIWGVVAPILLGTVSILTYGAAALVQAIMK
jgi:hypothetical protein